MASYQFEAQIFSMVSSKYFRTIVLVFISYFTQTLHLRCLTGFDAMFDASSLQYFFNKLESTSKNNEYLKPINLKKILKKIMKEKEIKMIVLQLLGVPM